MTRSVTLHSLQGLCDITGDGGPEIVAVGADGVVSVVDFVGNVAQFRTGEAATAMACGAYPLID